MDNYNDLVKLYQITYRQKLTIQKPVWLGECTTDNGVVESITIPLEEHYQKVFHLQDELFNIQLQIVQLGKWEAFIRQQRAIELEMIKMVFDEKDAKLFFPLHFNPDFLDK